MVTWNALYVRGSLPEVVELPIEGRFPVRRVGVWLEVEIPGFRDVSSEAVAISLACRGSVVWVQFRGTSAFQVMHCHDGSCLRRLEFSETWRIVEGKPQPWEATLLDHVTEDEVAEDEEVHLGAVHTAPLRSAPLRSAPRPLKLEVGLSQPVPRGFDSLCSALGVTGDQWRHTRSDLPLRVLPGKGTSPITIASRASGLGGALLLLSAPWVSSGVVAALLVAGAFTVFAAALACAWLRSTLLGRWFT